MKIGFIGFQGSGKTTLGMKFAEKHSLPFIDLDDVVCKTLGAATPALATKNFGLDAFRKAEKDANLEYPQVVLAFGGGATDSIQQAHTLGYSLIYLFRPFEEILEELKNKERPQWLPKGDIEHAFQTVWTKRHPIFLSCAELVIYARKEKILSELSELYGK